MKTAHAIKNLAIAVALPLAFAATAIAGTSYTYRIPVNGLSIKAPTSAEAIQYLVVAGGGGGGSNWGGGGGAGGGWHKALLMLAPGARSACLLVLAEQGAAKIQPCQAPTGKTLLLGRL